MRSQRVQFADAARSGKAFLKRNHHDFDILWRTPGTNRRF